MPITTLKIRFGGICMLWQVAAEGKLHVLMPLMEHDGSDHDDMKHCAMLVCDPKYSSANPSKPPVEQLGGRTIDLSAIGNPGTTHSMSDFANIARYANPGAPLNVDPRCLRDPLPDFMACRITLPLPLTLGALPKAALFEVPGSASPVRLFGQAEATFAVTDPTKLAQFSTPLQGDASGTLEVGILNIRVKDLNDPKEYKHFKNEPWEHQQSYYWLLDGWGDERRVGRPAIVAEDIGGDRYKPNGRDNECRKAKPDEWPPPNKFVDPYTCTLGGGCPPGENC
jgi:hypothetical protein